MRFKKGVQIRGIRSEMTLALAVIGQIMLDFKVEFVVTSVVDGKHSYGSLHYCGSAIDVRTRDLTEGQKLSLEVRVRSSLTNEYDVVLESDHLHVEYQPKGL